MTTTKAKLCHNPKCRSTGDHKTIHAKSLCQACYKARWRQKRATAQVELVAIESESESASALRHYLNRQVATRRRKLVRQLLDQGGDLDDVYAAFLGDDALRREFVDTAANAAISIKRDVQFWQTLDRGKSRPLLEVEKMIRQLQRLLNDPALAATPKARLLAQLSTAEDRRARLAREIVSLPGRGVIVQDVDDEAEYEDEYEDDEDQGAWNVSIEIPRGSADDLP